MGYNAEYLEIDINEFVSVQEKCRKISDEIEKISDEIR
jgi:hypothetical protein